MSKGMYLSFKPETEAFIRKAAEDAGQPLNRFCLNAVKSYVKTLAFEDDVRKQILREGEARIRGLENLHVSFKAEVDKGKAEIKQAGEEQKEGLEAGATHLAQQLTDIGTREYKRIRGNRGF